MADQTVIEWTDATWNPVTGCTKVSPGCKFCYAERITERRGEDFSKIVLHPDRLDLPLRWRDPRRVFVNSMSDLFHEAVPGGFIGRVFGRMAAAPQHIFQVLTKRPQRMHDLLADGVVGPLKREAEQTAWEIMKPTKWANEWGGLTWPLPNVWLGISAEDQPHLDERTEWLLKTPAAVRFLSLEPLLGPVDCRSCLQIDRYLGKPQWVRSGWRPEVQWVIVGGESGGPPERALLKRCNSGDPHSCRDAIGGSGRRHYHPKPEALEWIRSIHDQCVAAGIPFFFKQWGGPTAKSGGRLLDGRTWDEFPDNEGAINP